MKKYINYLSALLISLGSYSCNFLDKPILGAESLDTYFYNDSECNKYVTGLYQYITNGSWNPVYMWWVMTDLATDDGWIGSTYQPAKYVEFQPIIHYFGTSEATTNPYLVGFWECRYKGINEANIGIKRISEAEIPEEKKEQYLAEMKFLRAFFYFDLVRNFGGVPLVLNQLSTSEAKQVPRSSASEVYSQIEKDLVYSSAFLPYKNEAKYESGRINKGIAQSLLCKAYLYQDKFDEAYVMADSVINYGGYELEPDFNNVWSANDNSKEAIFEIQTISDQKFTLGNPCPVITGSRSDNGWAWGAPTSHLQKAFEKAGDEIRRRATIVVSGESIVGEPDVEKYEMNPNWHKSNRIIRKFYIPKAQRTKPYNANFNKLNHHIIRYADVLLMAAESAYHKSVSDENMAKHYLNMVRRRVYLPDCEASGNDLRDAIREERRLELAFEHSRLFDLRRWKGDDGKPMICHVMGPNGSFVKYNLNESTDPFETTNQIEPSDKGITFKEGRDELFPIPFREVQQTNGVIEQNPGF